MNTKRLLYFLYLTGLLLSCHNSDTAVSPKDPLYRRWRLTGTTDNFITFQPEGVILYGADSTAGVCCGPRFFIRQGSVLNLKDAPIKVLPAFVKPADCSFVRCAGPEERWFIISLTSTKLILFAYKSEHIYEAD